MKIYFDLDDVGNEFWKKLFAIYNEENNDNCNYLECEIHLIEEVNGIKADKKYFRKLLARKGLFMDLEPIPGYVELIKRLIAEGYEVRILTFPQWHSKHCMNEKVAWIKKHLPFFDLNNIIFTKLKGDVSGPNKILIDDNPFNLQDWEDNGGIGIGFGKIKYTQKWPGYKVDNFDELYALIKQIEREKLGGK